MFQKSAQELLDQLNLIIDQCENEDFYKSLDELSGSTLGQHIRHILEFFICLFDAKNDGIINYDNRKHDKLIEKEKKLAQSVLQSVQTFLDRSTEDFDIMFEANYTKKEGCNQSMKSSFYRELSYNIEHTIHHMALIKIAIKQSLNYITLPEHFGIANSTIRYQAAQNS